MLIAWCDYTNSLKLALEEVAGSSQGHSARIGILQDSNLVASPTWNANRELRNKDKQLLLGKCQKGLLCVFWGGQYVGLAGKGMGEEYQRLGKGIGSYSDGPRDAHKLHTFPYSCSKVPQNIWESEPVF